MPQGQTKYQSNWLKRTDENGHTVNCSVGKMLTQNMQGTVSYVANLYSELIMG